MTHHLLNDELQEVRRIARSAGAILRRYHTEETQVDWKAPGDPVTIADLEASEFIVGELRKLFPTDGILSEEMADDPSRVKQSRVWMVDPMDGTREFIDGREDFAVMIGLVIEGVPKLGVVYQPCTDKMYFAADGAGATLQHGEETRPLQVSSETVAASIYFGVGRSR